jgi:hypothetical protein
VERVMRKLVRTFVIFLAHRFGTKIVDQRTGRIVGRALIFPWRGKLQVIGIQAAMIPTFLPQERLTYWKQEIGFTTHPSPDFPNIRSASSSADKKENG